MDLKKLAEEAIALAKTAGTVLPVLGTGAAIAEKILGVVDSLKSEAPDDQTAQELEAAHQELYDAMIAKGHKLSDRLRGE